ncbi:MAG: transposase [Paracoccaceae bacterium]
MEHSPRGGIDEKTLEILAAEFTTSEVGDAPMLPELLDQIPPDQEIASVTADGAFDTRKCHRCGGLRGPIRGHGPPSHHRCPRRCRDHTAPQERQAMEADTAGAIARNEALRASKRLGRTIWRRWSGYHRRSRVETKMHCVKQLGQLLMAREFDRRVAEVQVRVAVMNGFTELGIPETQAVG